MLRLFFGRESLDKDKFIFDQISSGLYHLNQTNPDEKIILLVPDQFTLQAERNAFAYLEVPGLMNLDILSQSRLGYKVLSETGGSSRLPIDKYGRHMLLAKILTEENDQLEAFKGMNYRHSFIEMANNLISEMKQFNTLPEDLPAIIDVAEEHSILKRKLNDIHKIYKKYAELIAGKYIDTEDYINLFLSHIKDAKLVKNSEIWVYGFDYFTPKSLDILEQLMLTAKAVNVVLTADRQDYSRGTGREEICRDEDLFELTRNLMFKLKTIAQRNGIHVDEISIGKAYLIPIGKEDGKKSPALAHLEMELFANPTVQGKAGKDITLCRAANFYAEIETAAARITQLVRDHGLRYRDIVVICNDMETRASVIKRVFAEYGISAFLDKKRDILHNPVVEFITALLDIITKGWGYEDVFRLLKTGLAPITPDECENLENYCIKYRIKGTRWKSDFRYGLEDIGEEQLIELNLHRSRIFNYISGFEKAFNKVKTVRDKTSALYSFLKNEAEFPERIESLEKFLLGRNYFEFAEETTQIWTVIVNLLDQLVELIGEEELSNDDYGNILKSGFESVEIGLLPPTIDQVIVGTMQRTRTGNIKALIVIGANDGLLPAAVSTEGLLNEDEKAMLLGQNIEICKIDSLRAQEERLAIYKTLSKPSEFLWMSCSDSDIEGKEIKPSLIFDKIKSIFSDIEVTKDITNEDDPIHRIETPKSTLRHLTEAFRNALSGQPLREEWKQVLRWYKQANPPTLEKVESGLFFTNKQHRIDKDYIEKLYRKDYIGDLVLSPSRLERFSRCPFAHFIGYGLKPEERRVFEIAGREMGEVYHQCLMKLSEQLTNPDREITDPESPWMKVTKDECQGIIDCLIDEVSSEYKEGVLVQGEEERYRADRMKKVCGNAAWALVEHVQRGQISKVYFECEFGKSPEKKFPPIEIKLKEQTVRIEGKIDRVDILNGFELVNKDQPDVQGETAIPYIKIIDYKSGKEQFNAVEARKGWRLQLMLYLKAASQIGDNAKPAGVFYFEIAEPQIDATKFDLHDYHEKLTAEIKKSFKLDGIILNNPGVIESITGEFSGYSDILPVRKSKDGGFAGTTDGKILTEDEFAELQLEVDKTIEVLCSELTTGSIDIKPKKVKDETACKFCNYKGICYFDLSFEGCTYEVVK